MSRKGEFPISVQTTAESPFLPGEPLEGFSPIEPDEPEARSPLARTLLYVLQREVKPPPDCLLGYLPDSRLAAVAHDATGFRFATRARSARERSCWARAPLVIALYEAMPPFSPEEAEAILGPMLQGVTVDDPSRREAEVRGHSGALTSAYASSCGPNKSAADALVHATNRLITSNWLTTSSRVIVDATSPTRRQT
jgi:hypothetical protein